MGCCGQKRQQMNSMYHPAREVLTKQTRNSPSRPTVMFEYVGMGAFAVIGAVTGIRYAFERPGARVEVDARDWRFLSTLPGLRRP